MMMKNIVFLFISLFFNAVVSAEPPPLEAYGRLPGIDLMKVSPSGERYAFVAVIGAARKLMAVSSKGEILLSSDVGAVKLRDLEWVGENRILVWSTVTYNRPREFDDIYEFYSVANIDIKKHKTSNIFSDTNKVANFVFGYAGSAQFDGHDYGYFVAITFNLFGAYIGDQRNLYRVDLDSNEITPVSGWWLGPTFKWIVAADGSVVAHSTYDDKKGVWRLYAGLDAERPLLERAGHVDLIGLGRTADTVMIVDNSTGAAVTQEVSLSDGKYETLFADLTLTNILKDPKTGLAIGAEIVEEPRAIFFDDKLQARIKATRKAFPNLQMELVSYSQNLDRLIVKTEGDGDSGTFWLVNIASGNADPIGYLYPEIRGNNVGPTRTISYKASDGLDIDAVLTLPPGRKPEKLPLVVLPHGGPIGESDPVGFDWWAQAYASVGYAVLQPNFRGSGGRGKEFLQAGYGQWGRKMQTDLSDGVSALVEQGLVNPKRVCIVGASYGGYAALAGITLQQNIYRCAVSVSGPTNLSKFFRWQKERRGRVGDATRYWRAVTGADKEGDGVMKTISPTYFAEQVNVPVLLIHGKDDTVVPIEQSELMASALRSAKKPVEFIELPGEDHWLSREETRKTMLKASVEFVRKYNPPD